MWTLLLIILWMGGARATNDNPKVTDCKGTVHLISDDQLLPAFQPFSKPSHLPMHNGHCLGKKGFCWGPKALHAPACKTGSKKTAPLSSTFQSKRTRRPSLSFRALLMVHFVVACWRAHFCTASFLECPTSASKPQTHRYAERLYQPLASFPRPRSCPQS
jgi:hypothetical protein